MIFELQIRIMCRARQEVSLDELLHNCSRQMLGLRRYQRRRSATALRLGGRPRTVPPDHGGGRIKSHIQRDTHSTRVLRNAENSRGFLQLRTSKNQDHSIVHILSKSTNPTKSCLPLRSKPFRSISAFQPQPSICLMRRSSPAGSLVHA